LIFRSILGFSFILQNDIVPHIFMTIESVMALDANTCISSVWTVLTLAESPFKWRNMLIDRLIHSAQRPGLTKGVIAEPRNGFFLHDWVSDPKAVILHNHHSMSLLCPYRNYFAIRVRTGYSMLRWNIVHGNFENYLHFNSNVVMSVSGGSQCHMKIHGPILV
jgi:hypothetical protein